MHGGGPTVTSGQPLDPIYSQENLSLLQAGFSNLQKHIENASSFGVPVVVAINSFSTDTQKELELIQGLSRESGAFDAIVCSHWASGGAGAKGLGEAVIKACTTQSQFKFLYPLQMTLKVRFSALMCEIVRFQEKIKTIALRIYGASDVEYSNEAEERLSRYENQGFGDLPICMAKTHLSLSHDPALKVSNDR